MDYCIEWSGYVDKKGVAKTKRGNFDTRIARKVLNKKLNGNIIANSPTKHICSNKSCVNPNHLFQGKLQRQPLNNYPMISFIDGRVIFYLIKYLLDLKLSYKDISKMFQVRYSAMNNIHTFIEMPIEVIKFIEDYKMWEYVELVDTKKIEGLQILRNHFPLEKCIDYISDIKDAYDYPFQGKNKRLITARQYVYQKYKNSSHKGNIYSICQNPNCIRLEHLVHGT